MTKSAAMFQFWSSFGIPAYDELSVPVGEPFPYISYQRAIDGLDAQVALSASVWYRGSSIVELNEKVEEIAKAFSSRKKCVVPCDGGALVFYRETPFAQELGDDKDDLIKRMVINYSVRFVTNY